MGLRSIDKEVALELAKFPGESLILNGLRSIDKDVAKEFSEYKGLLELRGLQSIDEETLQTLKSRPRVGLPPKYK